MRALGRFSLQLKPRGLDDLLHGLMTDSGLRNNLGHVDLLLLGHGDGHLNRHWHDAEKTPAYSLRSMDARDLDPILDPEI